MTKDEINAKISECEAELKTVKHDLAATGSNRGIGEQDLLDLNRRQGELQTEIATLSAMLDEL